METFVFMSVDNLKLVILKAKDLPEATDKLKTLVNHQDWDKEYHLVHIVGAKVYDLKW